MPFNGFRRSRRLIAATVAIAATGGTAALAFTGEPGTNGPPTSSGPDLISATIIRKVDPGDPLGPQARVCYDEVINPATLIATGIALVDYDSDNVPISTNSTIDTNDPTCLIATYANGLDIGQFSLLVNTVFGTSGVQDVGGTQAPQASAPLLGTATNPTELAAVAGSTTAPDLVSTSIDAGATPPQITYTFDENLDPALAGGGAALAGKFGFYVDTDNGTAPRTGSSIIGVSRKSIVVGFTVPQTVGQAKRFFVAPTGAGTDPRDRIPGNDLFKGGGPFNTRSPIGSAGIATTGAPSLVSAAKQASNQVVDLTFAQAVIPGTTPGNAVAYRADASPIGGTYAIGTSGANTSTLPLTLPSTTQIEPTSVVRVGLIPGIVNNQANDRTNAWAAAAISTEPMRPGYTDGPDLIAATVDDATNRVTYKFDEAIQDNPTATFFRVINSDATTTNGNPGTAVLNASKTEVSVQFSGGVSGASIAGVSNLFGTTTDSTTDGRGTNYGSVPGSNASPNGSVSLQPIACQPGTCPVDPTPTPSPTTTPGPTVTPTPTVTPPQRVTIRANVKSLKQKGSKVTGRVAANAPCKSGRSVKLRKGGKTIATAKSKGNGRFTLKSKKARKGKLVVKIQRRKLTRGGVQVTCKAAQKRV